MATPYFSGSVRVRWGVDDPRDMITLDAIWFTDSSGTDWTVPKYSYINGASVPWFFRRILPAYIGRYRRASVIHDVACTKKLEPSWKVHRMFYEAMRCDNTHIVTAYIMWLAVRCFGPRFKGLTKLNPCEGD